jgi:hypothetical protein
MLTPTQSELLRANYLSSHKNIISEVKRNCFLRNHKRASKERRGFFTIVPFLKAIEHSYIQL